MDLYHGSEKIVEYPVFGEGNVYNDYGLGFYCTRERELAREWACSEEKDGFANKYDFIADRLRVLYLNNGEYSILNWLAILLENRRFELSTPVAARSKKFILDNYLPPYKEYDVIIGYRADDSYFSFSRAFLSNSITLKQLERAMTLGKLGEQVVIRSKAAFEQIFFISSEPVDASVYYPKRMSRDRRARLDYMSMLSQAPGADAVYISDLIGKFLRRGLDGVLQTLYYQRNRQYDFPLQSALYRRNFRNRARLKRCRAHRNDTSPGGRLNRHRKSRVLDGMDACLSFVVS